MERDQTDSPVPGEAAAAQEDQIGLLLRQNAELTQQVNELTRKLHDQELREALGAQESQRPRRRAMTPHAWGLSAPEVDQDAPSTRAL